MSTAMAASGSSVTLELRQLKIDAWTYDRWLKDNPEFRGMVNEAKAIRFEAAFDEAKATSPKHTQQEEDGYTRIFYSWARQLSRETRGFP